MNNLGTIARISTVCFLLCISGCGESWEEKCREGCENFIFCLGVTEGVDDCVRLCLSTLDPCFHSEETTGFCSEEEWCDAPEYCRIYIQNFCELSHYLVSCNSSAERDCETPGRCIKRAVNRFNRLPDTRGHCSGYVPDLYHAAVGE